MCVFLPVYICIVVVLNLISQNKANCESVKFHTKFKPHRERTSKTRSTRICTTLFSSIYIYKWASAIVFLSITKLRGKQQLCSRCVCRVCRARSEDTSLSFAFLYAFIYKTLLVLKQMPSEIAKELAIKFFT